MYILSTENADLTLSEQGTLTRLNRGDTEYLDRASVLPLMSVLYSDVGSMWEARTWRRLDPERMTVSETPDGVRVIGEGFGGKAIVVQVDITADRREFVFNTLVRNEDTGVVAGVAVPRIGGFVEHEHGTLYTPNKSGKQVPEPFEAFREIAIPFLYPAQMSAQFMTYNTGRGGWSIYCLDHAFQHKNMIVGGADRVLEIVQYCFLEPGKEGTLAPVVLDLYQGAWHAAADRYREWFEAVCRKPSYSPLVTRMAPTDMVVVLSRPVEDPDHPDIRRLMEWRTYAEAATRIRQAKTEGYTGIHLVGWQDRGHDTEYPEHAVSERMGGPEEMRRMGELARREGMSLCYYLNAHLCNLKSELYQQNPHWAIIPADGVDKRETWGAEVFDVACPAAEGFRRQIFERVRDLVENYAADAVQLDQVAAQPSLLCFNPEHGHTTPATAWYEGYRRMLDEMMHAMRAINPNFWIWIEGVNDALGQFVDVQMACSWKTHPAEQTFVELYRYTFPWQYLIWEPFLGGLPWWVKRPFDPAVTILARHADLFHRARFMDDLGLSFDSGAVRANWYTTGHEIMIMVQNRTDAPLNASLKLARKYLPDDPLNRGCVALSDGRALMPSIGEDGLCVEIALESKGTDGLRLTS